MSCSSGSSSDGCGPPTGPSRSLPGRMKLHGWISGWQDGARSLLPQLCSQALGKKVGTAALRRITAQRPAAEARLVAQVCGSRRAALCPLTPCAPCHPAVDPDRIGCQYRRFLPADGLPAAAGLLAAARRLPLNHPSQIVMNGGRLLLVRSPPFHYVEGRALFDSLLPAAALPCPGAPAASGPCS